MARAQKPDFIFRRNGRVHLNRRGRQFSRLLAAEACASAVVMLDKPCSEVVWRVLTIHYIRQFPFTSLPVRQPCAVTFQMASTKKLCLIPSFPDDKSSKTLKKTWKQGIEVTRKTWPVVSRYYRAVSALRIADSGWPPGGAEPQKHTAKDFYRDVIHLQYKNISCEECNESDSGVSNIVRAACMIWNALRTERNLFRFLWTQIVPHSKHTISVTKRQAIYLKRNIEACSCN